MKTLILFANGMEDNEALSTLALLRRANINIVSASLEDSVQVKTAYGVLVNADTLLKDINLNEFDTLIIPGGGWVSKGLTNKPQVYEVIDHFDNNDNLIAAICAAPYFLGTKGKFSDLDYTAFPSDIVNEIPGKYLKNQKVVKTGNYITGRSAGSIIEFVSEIIETKLGSKAKKELLEDIIY